MALRRSCRVPGAHVAVPASMVSAAKGTPAEARELMPQQQNRACGGAPHAHQFGQGQSQPIQQHAPERREYGHGVDDDGRSAEAEAGQGLHEAQVPGRLIGRCPQQQLAPVWPRHMHGHPQQLQSHPQARQAQQHRPGPEHHRGVGADSLFHDGPVHPSGQDNKHQQPDLAPADSKTRHAVTRASSFSKRRAFPLRILATSASDRPSPEVRSPLS